MSVDRLLKRKKRLTKKITRRDNRRLNGLRIRGRQIIPPLPVGRATVLRSRIYKTDLLLEKAGYWNE